MRSGLDKLDLTNDVYGLLTLFSHYEKVFGSKFITNFGSGLSIVNSIGQAIKTWTAADSMAYMSAAASTLAYKMIKNDKFSAEQNDKFSAEQKVKFSAEQKVKWYAIFQTISNASLVSWYYYDGKIAEKKGDNGFYILGNALDIGLSIVSNPSTLGLADAATKAILNEQIVSTVWAVKHGIARFKLPWKHATYTAEDELIARYLLQNTQLIYIINKKFEKGLENKLQLNVLPSTLYKLPGNKRVLSIAVNKNKLSVLSLRLLGPVSGTYADDLVRLRNTSLSFADWAYNDIFFNEYDKQPVGRIYNLTQYDSNTIILNILLKDVVNRIEVLGWLSKANEDTKPYYTMIDLSNLNEVDITKLSSKDERINKEIQTLENNKKVSLTDDLDRTNIDKIKKIYSYLIGQGYTIFNPVNQKIITDTDMPNYWLALKYSNRNFMSRVFFFDGKKLYYELHDELTGAVKKNDWDNYKSCEYPLTLNHPISEMIEKSNELGKRVVNATGLKYYFPNLESSMSCYKDKLPFISDYKVIVKSKSSDIIKGYYNESLDSIYLDNSVEDVILEYKYDIQAPLVFKINNKYIDEYPNGLYQINKKYDEKIKINTLTLTLKRGFFKYIDYNLNIELITEPGSGYEFVSFGHSILVEKSKDLTYPQPPKTVKLEYSTNNIPKALIASEISGINKDDIAQVTWKNDKGDVVGTDNSLTLINLSVGEHTYILELTDSNGDEFVYNVVVSVEKNIEEIVQNNECTLFHGHYSGLWANAFAFAALKKDGTVVTWGDPDYGGDSSSVKDKLTNVKAIYSSFVVFAALKKDGTVVTWGHPNYGADYDYSIDSSSVKDKLTNVKAIYSSRYAFAALKKDGTVVTWGVSNYGGDSSSVKDKLTNVKTIYSTVYAFAALKKDGTVVTWGDKYNGGDSSSVADKLTNVKTIYSTQDVFAALKKDGTVVTWGDPYYGGDSSSVADKLTNVKAIYSTINAFAALKKDGTVVTWGDPYYGGDSSSVKDKLTNVKAIYSTNSAFAALKKDGTVVTWGHKEYGGDSSRVADKLTNVKAIYSTNVAFAALKKDGTVVTWGDSNSGGDSSSVADKLTNVKTIYSTNSAFAALKKDGTVVTWGFSKWGGDSSSVADKLTNIVAFSPSYIWQQCNNDKNNNQPNEKQILEVKQAGQVINTDLSKVKTIKCSALNPGDTFTINGYIYHVVDNNSIRNLQNKGQGYAFDLMCTSKVTDMSYLFSRDKIGYITDLKIAKWDTSNVINMSHMFDGYYEQGNLPLSDWNTSNVTDMSYMFANASDFDCNINNWDTSKVTSMKFMFYGASSFNQPIGNWDTSNVSDMSWMFFRASSFNQNISSWCVKNISSKPEEFDYEAGFEGKDELQPKWGTCPK